MNEAFLPFTAWDYFILSVAILSVVMGLLRGFVRTVFGLAAWLVAAVAALLFSPPLVAALQVTWPLPFSMFLVFLVVFLATRILGGLIARALAWIGLGSIDRLLGGLLGVLRAALIVVVAALAGSMIDLHRQAAWQHAWSRPVLDEILSRFAGLIPEIVPAARRALEA